MRSPFPGMDPYLESPTHWSDFHAHLVTALTNALSDLLSEEYVAKMNALVMMISPTLWDEPDERSYLPDVTLHGKQQSPSASDASSSATSRDPHSGVTTVVLENVRCVDEYVETYVEILRLPERQVVTVIELLSPTNKYGEGRGIYMKKRRDFLAQPINIVEIDLLRAGSRLEFAAPIPANHYHAFISPVEHRPQTTVVSSSVRDRLPTIAIPLRSADAPIDLNLAGAFDTAYHNGRYKKVVDYSTPPASPSFSESEVEWISKLPLPLHRRPPQTGL